MSTTALTFTEADIRLMRKLVYHEIKQTRRRQNSPRQQEHLQRLAAEGRRPADAYKIEMLEALLVKLGEPEPAPDSSSDERAAELARRFQPQGGQ